MQDSIVLKLAIALLFIGLPLNQVNACSAFCLSGKSKVVVGKSYDWFFLHGHGAVYTNIRGTQRTGLNLDNSENPASWKSKYGSLTFTQFGRGFPIGGLNEKGLVIEMLQVDESGYNSAEVEKPFINEAQFTQYQLDNYSSVDEVIANIDKIRIVEAYTGIY